MSLPLSGCFPTGGGGPAASRVTAPLGNTLLHNASPIKGDRTNAKQRFPLSGETVAPTVSSGGPLCNPDGRTHDDQRERTGYGTEHTLHPTEHRLAHRVHPLCTPPTSRTSARTQRRIWTGAAEPAEGTSTTTGARPRRAPRTPTAAKLAQPAGEHQQGPTPRAQRPPGSGTDGRDHPSPSRVRGNGLADVGRGHRELGSRTAHTKARSTRPSPADSMPRRRRSRAPAARSVRTRWTLRHHVTRRTSSGRSAEHAPGVRAHAGNTAAADAEQAGVVASAAPTHYDDRAATARPWPTTAGSTRPRHDRLLHRSRTDHRPDDALLDYICNGNLDDDARPGHSGTPMAPRQPRPWVTARRGSSAP